ncbi:MAG: gliding motility-associated C-terminal domain-containing protein [Cyclobacteriaceae bacterium]
MNQFFTKILFVTILVASAAINLQAGCPTPAMTVIEVCNDAGGNGTIRAYFYDGDPALSYVLFSLSPPGPVSNPFGPITVNTSIPLKGAVAAVEFGLVPNGDYIIRVNCSPSGTLTLGGFGINVNSANALLVTPTVDKDCNPLTGLGNADGSINLNISGGVAPYNITWTAVVTPIANSIAPVAGIYPFPNLDGGAYTVEIADANNCIVTLNITVPGTTLPLAGSDQVACGGAATLSANSPAVNETGTWTGPAGVTFTPNANTPTAQANNLAPGSNILRWTITDNTAICPANFDEVEFIFSPAINLSASITNVLCNGASTGAINLAVTGGTGPFTFLWSNAAVSEDLVNVPAGTYSVTATDATLCTSTLSNLIVNSPASAVSATTSKVDVACYGGATGSITITGVGGVAPYDFSKDGGVIYAAMNLANHTFVGLTAGNYSLRVRDANGCETALVPVTITEPSVVSGTFTQVNVTCFGGSNGSISITGAGGVAPYDFSIDGGATYSVLNVASNTFASLAQGSYNLFVRDANNCISAVITVTLTQPAAVSGTTSQTNVACFGGNTGSITITGAGGTGLYDFSIDGGVTYPALNAAANTFTTLTAGNYNLRVRDDNNCVSIIIPVTITQPAAGVSGTTSKVDVACNGGSTGSITITGVGGVAPYDFSRDGGATYPVLNVANTTFSGLSAGPYDLTVRDANNCQTGIISVSITQPPVVSGTFTQVNVTCFGGSNGSISITGGGGVAPYDFSIDGGATYSVLNVANNTFASLAQGSYNLTVRDANDCISAVIPVTITQPAAVSGTTTQTNVVCFGGNTGSITITGAGGTGPYDFSIDGGTTYPALNVAANTFTTLTAGNYNLRVRDANNCESIITPVTITQPAAGVSGTTSKVDVACNGGSTGSITITGAGGVAPYDFSIDGGTTYPILDVANGTFPGLSAGPYNLTVRDANNCQTAVIPVSITQPATVVSGTFTQVNVTCFGGGNGSISITGAGGIAPYDFSIDGGATYGVLNVASNTFGSLIQGGYSLTVRDANDCISSVIPVTITQPAEVTAVTSANGPTTICAGSLLPDIIFMFTGTAPYDFTYTDGTTPVNITGHNSTGFTITTAPAGTYSVTALTGANGCVSSNLGGSVVITVDAAAVAGAGGDQSICSGNVATLAGASVGGSATSAAWSVVSQPPGGDGLLSNTAQTATPSTVTFSATVAGAYTLRLTTNDPAGVCNAVSDDVVITVQSAATVDAGNPQTTCVLGQVTLAATFSGTTSVLWSTSGDGSFNNPALANAVYTLGPNDLTTVTLTLTTGGPCASVNDNVVITVNPAPTVDAGVPQTICSTSAISLNASFGGSATGLIWTSSGNGTFDDNTDTNATYTLGSVDLTNGSVMLTATATGSCSGTSDNVTITINPAATIDAGTPQTVCVGSTITLDGTLTGSATSVTWTRSGDGTFNNVNDPDPIYTPGINDRTTGTVTLTATSNNPAGPCPAATDNVLITIIPVPGDQITAGNETWIGYVYNDLGDPTAVPAKINFANSKYRGFVNEADIDNMSGASTYDLATDEFDLNLGLALSIQGTNVCGSYLNNFSVRYKMSKTLPKGIYRFTVGGDDGVRLLIDGVNVLPVAAFDFQSYTSYTSVPICLSAGVHAFEIHYFDNTAQSRLTFNYEEVPVLNTTSPVAVCINSAAPVLTASSTDVDVLGFNWYKGVVLVGTGGSYTPSAAELNMTAVGTETFNVASIYACGETVPTNVVVNVLNAATLAINPETVCASGGVVDLRSLVAESPSGGTFVFAGHPNISGNNFDPSGLAGSTIPITVNYSSGSCSAPQGTLNLTVTGSALITVPAASVSSCETAPDIDLTTLVSASPSGGTFIFSGTQVTGSTFNPSGLSGAQTITVNYSIGSCTAPVASFQINVTNSATLAINSANACQNGGLVNLLTLVTATPTGGTFAFSGTGVSGSAFNPSGQSGIINIVVNYDINGCTANGNVQITVLNPTNPACGGSGSCASVIIVPKPESATCTNSDGRVVFSIKPFVPAVNNTGVKISFVGISSTNLSISRTNFNDSIFNNIPKGTYDYSIEYGDPSCIKTGQFTIDQSGTVATPIASNITSPVCFNTATGGLTLSVPGETGNVLEWSLDAGILDPFKPFTAGGQISGIPAGTSPTFERVISVRRNVGDPCYASVTVVIPEVVTNITATFNIVPSTCNGNDGAITSILSSGGNGIPYSFSIDLGASYQTATSFNGLAGGSYTLRVKDAAGCENNFTANVTFPGFINSAISKQNADCTNDGNSGSISVTINDPGVYQVALSTDQFNEPADNLYQSYSNPSITFGQLSRGQYFVYLKSNTAACPTRSAPINIFGVYAINFDMEPSCNGNELSITLVNITGETTGAPLEVQISKKLSTDPPEIIYTQFPLDGQIFLAFNQHVFLQTPGEYRIKIIQYQNEVVCTMSSQVIDFTVPVPMFARAGAVEESYPDVATGKLHITGFVGGLNPYDVRIELDSASSFALPAYETNFEVVGLNGNQQFEKIYEKVPAGRYLVEVIDSLGCSIQFFARVPLDKDIFIPNVFTPNGDGSNDVFFIRNLPTLPSANELIVSNRWGKQVFVSENYQNNWDGEGIVDGIYFYRLMVEQGDPMIGWIEIIRGQKP